MKRKYPEDVWEMIKKAGEDECWLWVGRTTTTKDKNGYGYIGINGKEYVAHRIVYWLSNPGEIDLGAPKDKSLKQFVLHKCDNRLCCNPKHLFLGNYDDNNKDAKAKGRCRFNMVRGESHHLAKLNMDKARDIRARVLAGDSRAFLARLYNVSTTTIDNVVNNVRYAE